MASGRKFKGLKVWTVGIAAVEKGAVETADIGMELDEISWQPFPSTQFIGYRFFVLNFILHVVPTGKYIDCSIFYQQEVYPHSNVFGQKSVEFIVEKNNKTFSQKFWFCGKLYFHSLTEDIKPRVLEVEEFQKSAQ